MGYYFNESLGMEANAFFFSSNPRDSVKDLAKNNGVLTSSLVSAKSYMGIDAQWIPIYGKIALYNKKIVPFDLYLATGYGLTGTTNGQSAGTLHLGTGQIFAISKGMAWRWDFSWNFYSAKGIDGKIQSFNDLFLSVGVSLFFPEAKYR
jgi:outer membrane beta-barrel protein